MPCARHPQDNRGTTSRLAGCSYSPTTGHTSGNASSHAPNPPPRADIAAILESGRSVADIDTADPASRCPTDGSRLWLRVAEQSLPCAFSVLRSDLRVR